MSSGGGSGGGWGGASGEDSGGGSGGGSGRGERARLFAALELPTLVSEELVRWRSVAVHGVAGLRTIRPEDLHVTLCFLGWQPVSAAADILAACAAAAGRPAAPLRVVEAIWLPPRRPRVLAVSLEDGARALADVQHVLSDALARGGWYVPEKRPFLAHVTVARVARDGRIPRDLTLEAPPELGFFGSRVTLFRSRLSSAGARYEPLGTVALGED